MQQALEDDPERQEVGGGDGSVLDLPSDEDPRSVVQTWELTSSDEEPEPPRPAVPRRLSTSGCQRAAWAAVVDSVASKRVRGASAVAASSAAPPDAEPQAAFAPHICRVSAWPKMYHSCTADMDACPRPGGRILGTFGQSALSMAAPFRRTVVQHALSAVYGPGLMRLPVVASVSISSTSLTLRRDVWHEEICSCSPAPVDLAKRSMEALAGVSRKQSGRDARIISECNG